MADGRYQLYFATVRPVDCIIGLLDRWYVQWWLGLLLLLLLLLLVMLGICVA
jgi:hypothetical protein